MTDLSAKDARRQALLQQRLRSKAGRKPASLGIEPLPRDRPHRASFGQERLWVIDQIQADRTAYLIPMALRLRGALQPALLARALDAVVARHEVLRTHYEAIEGIPYQRFSPPAPRPLTVVELGPDQGLHEVIAADGRVAFDLAQGPLVRATLVRLAEAEHVLLITMHHIVSDGWSMEVLARELGALYAAFADDRPSPLAPLPIQYADFAAWQRQALTGDLLEAQLGYWRTQLADLEPLALPTDRPRPAIHDPAGDTVRFVIPQPIATALTALGRAHNATPFMVLLAAFQVLLARTCAQTDIAVGTPIAGRTRVELEPLIGFFVNTLVLRARTADDPSFVDFLATTRDTALAAYAHQDLPFERLVEALHPQRDLSRNPLFQVMFSLHTTAPARLELAGLDVEPLAVDWHTAKFDLNLGLAEQPDGSLAGGIELATALFDRATIERFADHYRQLLASIVADPAARLSRLPLLPAAERDQLLHWSHAHLPGPRPDACVHQLFERQAAATPHATAVVFGDRTLSYAALNARANRLAHDLRARGVGPDDLIAVCLERSDELIVTLLAILKAGAAYVPLDPSYPRDRLDFLLRDTRARLVISEHRFAHLLEAADAPRLLLDVDRDRIASFPDHDPAPVARPDNLAYVIYTSGSTGRPKGVAIPHANVFHLFACTAADFGFGPHDVWTFFHSYAFDFSVWEIWGALLYGGQLVVVPFEVSRSPSDFLDLLVARGVTIVNQTPSAFRGLAALADEADPRFDRMAVRTVVFGGEALDVASLASWFRRFGDDRPRLINMYGITETTVHVTYRPITAHDLRAVTRSPIGRALAKDRLYLLDPAMNPVPIGVPGEIYVGGDSLTRGYLHRPALTAERLVPNPFARAPGERLYRTGDQARWLATGEVEFLGRLDDQVKIRGFRIELGEIQAVLSAHPAVREALVTLHRTDEPHLIAYVVLGHARRATVSELRAFLADRLPGYMVPAFVMILPRLAQTANGKLDRKALPVPDGARAAVGGGYVAPRSPSEAQHAAVWADALGLDTVGVHDNFFALGGDSIRALRLVGALRQLGHAVAIQDLFKHATIAELCAHAQPASRDVHPQLAPFALVTAADRAALPADLEDAYPLARIQTGMVYEMLADTTLHLYHNVTRYRIRDDHAFSLAALNEAVQLLLERHAILRTSFDLTTYSQPLQLVHRRAPYEVPCDDLRHLPADAQDRALAELLRRERSQPIDVASVPLLRFHVVRDTDDGWWLIFTECHAILDGWSHNSLLTELTRCYRALRDGQPLEDAPPQVRYADFIALEQQVLRSAPHRAFWAARVREHERLELPDGWRDLEGDEVWYDVRVPLTDLQPALRQLARAAGVPIKSVLLAAHLKVLSTISGQPAFFCGVVCNGRPEVAGGDRVAGMFLNTVPFLAELTAATWRQLVQAVFAQEVALWPFRRYPLPAMQAEWGATPLIEVIFNYLDFHILDRETVDLTQSADDSPNEFALHVSTAPSGLVLTARSRRIARPYGQQLGALYRTTLAAMVADLDGDPRRSVLPADVRQQVLARWNADVTAVPPRSFTETIEAQVRATPHATAVVWGDARVSYAALNARANQIAHALRARGLGPESVVGVCLERGVELLASLLAVHKAGAAYIPLDPALPADRRRYMLAGAALVLTRRALLDQTAPPLLRLDDDHAELAAQPAHDLAPIATPDHLAYIIYTSGSTGQPKGVMIPRGALANLLGSMAARPGLVAGDVLVAVTTISFDIAALELFAPLLVGATVVVADEARDPQQLMARIASAGATVVQATPATWRLLLDAGFAPPAGFTTLCGGDKLAPDLAARLCASGARVWDLYGPTETTVWSSTARLVAGRVDDFAPVANTTLHVLDHALEPAPLGVVGELYIGGLGLARGYRGRPALTAERFLPDPHATLPGQRCYRTGDLARRHADGRIEILGRTDHQLKIRGYRIEPGEIEAALAAHPEIATALVHPTPTPHGDRQLTAYLLLRGGRPPEPDELRSFLARSLPDYMLPAAFVVLDAFPMTANQKVDRNQLPLPGLRSVSREYAAPHTLVERQLAALWAEALEVEQVGIHDDFFELGGHSLLILKIVHQARDSYGLRLRFKDLLRHRTIAALSAATARTTASPVSSLIRFHPADPARPLFCVHPGGGSSHWYRELAHALGTRLPLVAFEWPGFDHEAIKATSIEDIAQRYLDELRQAQPRGPYRLLGWCGGIAIAWELARRLQAAGERVCFMLIDPMRDDRARDHLGQEGQLFRRCEQLFEVIERRPSAEEVEASMQEILQIFGRAVEYGRVAREDLSKVWHHRVTVWRQLVETRLAYQLPPYAGRVDLIVSDDVADGTHEACQGLSYDDYVQGWAAHADVQLHRARGGHFTILKPPCVDELARLLVDTIDHAEEAAPCNVDI